MEYTEMKDRIAHIIRAKNLTAAEFALQLGIQPSNVSHLLAGRNNPSLDFVKKLKESFPEYNLDWIVFGVGPMTVSEPFYESKSSFEVPQIGQQPVVPIEKSYDGTLFAPEKESGFAQESPSFNPEKKSGFPQESNQVDSVELKRIILVYSDNSFEILSQN